MAKTWDMVTSGPDAGTLVRPLRYTTTEGDATRVRVWCKLATPLGANIHRTNEGLPFERMLSPEASDAERVAYVRDLVLDDPGVESVIGEPTVERSEGETKLSISVTFQTTDGATVTIGA